MGKRKPRYYWDSCVFIALLKDESSIHGERVMQRIEEMSRQAIAGEIQIVTSSLWRLEVLPENGRDGYEAMASHFEQGSFLAAAATDEVFSKVLEFRLRFGKRKLPLGDTIHLATAAVARCSTLFTLDKDLLGISSHVSEVRIVRPESETWLFEP